MNYLKYIILSLAALCFYPCVGQDYQGKAIYHPEEFKNEDFTDSSNKWSTKRMACTENIALFWAEGFGDNITNAPDLDGNNMKVDLANLLAKLESYYKFFYNDLGWTKPGTKADKYRIMVMLDYSLEGTAYGGSYDDAIGALWITPNRVQDERLNCIAHELGHSFQSQIWCDGEGVSWGGCGFFEMASQWMLWQVNPDWQTDEYYHLKAFQDLTYKAFLHIDNIYHSPYVLEYWGEKHGKHLIAELFRQGTEDEDPVMTYQRVTSTDQTTFNDEMFDAIRRMVNWDYPRVWENTRRYACNGWKTKLIEKNGRWMPSPDNCPENYGFNVIELNPQCKNGKITVNFKGEMKAKGYHTINVDAAGWRYGLVAVNDKGQSIFSDVMDNKNGNLQFQLPTNENITSLYLVVMGAPNRHWRNIDGEENPGDAQWPYSFTISGTTILE